MNILRVTASMDPSMGGPPQGIRNSIGELERLGIRNEVVSCDAPDAAWLGRDSFPIHALGPGKYGFAYTPKLGPWLEENLSRFDAVIVHGLWLWPSVCAVRAVRALRRKRKTEMNFSHRLTRINTDGSERLAADRTKGECLVPGTPALGGLSAETTDGEDAFATYPLSPQVCLRAISGHSAYGSALSPTKQLRCFVMPHGMLDPWFQRDKSRRVKAVRNWFYWWLVERNVVNSADALLFTCQQELELARTTFGGYRPRRVINVGYGIAEPPAFEPKMREAFAAKCPGLNGRPYLFFMSRIHAKKGVDLLVRAYARVRAEHGAWSREHGATARAEGGGQIDTEPSKDFSHSRSEAETAEGKLTQPTDRETALRQSDEDGSERLAADRPGENAAGPVTRAGDGQSQQNGKGRVAFPDLVIAGPGWESRYGEEVRMLIDEVNRSIALTEHRTLNTEPRFGETAPRQHSAPIHAVGMLSGAEKWGALYGCEAFVLPSHQENFGIAVVEALACGKPVLISNQVNIWREIVEDGAGLVEGDTEEGVEKLLRKFLNGWRVGPSEVVSPSRAERAEVSGRSAFAPSDSLLHSATAAQDGVTRGGPRECYLKRFAIGPAARRLKGAVMGDG